MKLLDWLAHKLVKWHRYDYYMWTKYMCTSRQLIIIIRIFRSKWKKKCSPNSLSMDIFVRKNKTEKHERWKIRRTRVAAQRTVKTLWQVSSKSLSLHRRMYCIQSFFSFFCASFPWHLPIQQRLPIPMKMSWKYAAAAATKWQQKNIVEHWILNKNDDLFSVYLIRITQFEHTAHKHASNGVRML